MLTSIGSDTVCYEGVLRPCWKTSLEDPDKNNANVHILTMRVLLFRKALNWSVVSAYSIQALSPLDENQYFKRSFIRCVVSAEPKSCCLYVCSSHARPTLIYRMNMSFADNPLIL